MIVSVEDDRGQEVIETNVLIAISDVLCYSTDQGNMAYQSRTDPIAFGVVRYIPERAEVGAWADKTDIVIGRFRVQRTQDQIRM